MRRNAGFSLIEVMVVMAILAGLIGTVTVMLNLAQKKQKIFITTTRIQAIVASLELMKSGDKLSMYPPTKAEAIILNGQPLGKQLGTANDKNQGIESLWVATHLARVGVVPTSFEEEDSLGNSDGDSAVSAVAGMKDAVLREYLDAWGNPLIYIHSRDYKDMSKVERYVRLDNTEVKVAPKPGAAGGFANESTYQLWSLGPDGEPGTEDDVLGW